MKNIQKILFYLLVITTLFLSGCSNIKNKQTKIDNNGLIKHKAKWVVDANNQFTFDLYSKLINSNAKKNIFYSPYSISAALAMTYEWARWQTAKEIKSVFYFPKQNILRPNFSKIYNEINKKNDAYELKTSNNLWIEKSYSLLTRYVNTIQKYYGWDAKNLDFKNEPEKSRETINNFVAKQTNNKIKKLLPKWTINTSTRLVITNVIYFKWKWKYPFEKRNTKEKDFYISPSNVVKTKIMSMYDNNLNYADLDKLQILELPYSWDKLSMLILLPKINLKSIESLNTENLELWKKQMHKINIDKIYIPKFEFKTTYKLKNILKTLWITTAFDDKVANFSGITGKRDLHIDQVIHKAYIKVEEEWTEAAAATAVVMSASNSMPNPQPKKLIIFNANHPFIFLIQDKKTGEILFFGKVVDPTK